MFLIIYKSKYNKKIIVRILWKNTSIKKPYRLRTFEVYKIFIKKMNSHKGPCDRI